MRRLPALLAVAVVLRMAFHALSSGRSWRGSRSRSPRRPPCRPGPSATRRTTSRRVPFHRVGPAALARDAVDRGSAPHSSGSSAPHSWLRLSSGRCAGWPATGLQGSASGFFSCCSPRGPARRWPAPISQRRACRRRARRVVRIFHLRAGQPALLRRLGRVGGWYAWTWLPWLAAAAADLATMRIASARLLLAALAVLVLVSNLVWFSVAWPLYG